MLNFSTIPSTAIPLSLYIHLPWCVKKCPYCDFNSHQLPVTHSEQDYVAALQKDLLQDLPDVQDRKLSSIFFGGGTPSLFSAAAIAEILDFVAQKIAFAENIEITLEANPGTAEQEKFHGFRAAGVNRLSIGCQSFQADKLTALGRIHNPDHAMRAAEMAHAAGFTTFNLDLMFGLPQQTLDDALFDLQTAMQLKPTHISWYQLTLEPNTLFEQKPPPLPDDELIWQMQKAGQSLLAEHNFRQYEVSAYAQAAHQCRHNLNYWQFGDYLGIGAGAHSKITDFATGAIKRAVKIKHPKSYITAAEKNNFLLEKKMVPKVELPFEFMLNALRLSQAITKPLFETRTGLPWSILQTALQQAAAKDYIELQDNEFTLTTHGRNFLNNVVELFLS